MQQERLILLLTKELSGRLLPEEQQELEAGKLLTDEPLLVAAMVTAMEAVPLAPVSVDEAEDTKAIAAILGVDSNLEERTTRPVFIMGWMKVAAVLLTLTLGTWLWLTPLHKADTSVATTQKATDIAPGTQKAQLTIGDNSPIDLQQQPSGIRVGNNITYAGGEVIAPAGEWLTLTVPRGGNYTITLADGSKVWLNAASKIQFPSRFTGEQREVSLTGEAYFEIAPDGKKPFVVRSATQNVEVLGTSFNINAYPDEAVQTTTLVTGKVRVNASLTDSKSPSSMVLEPGQQVKLEAGKGMQRSMANMEAALAWKEGVFHFDGADVKTVMRQLERWYDIDVVFEQANNPARFQGEVGKQLMLREVLEILTESKVKYTLEGRKLIIH